MRRGKDVGGLALFDLMVLRSAAVFAVSDVVFLSLGRARFDLLLAPTTASPRSSSQPLAGSSAKANDRRDPRSQRDRGSCAYRPVSSRFRRRSSRRTAGARAATGASTWADAYPRSCLFAAATTSPRIVWHRPAVGGDFYDFIEFGQRQDRHHRRRRAGQGDVGGTVDGA